MNRRSFIQNSALASAAVLFSPNIVIGKKPKVIIIGAGLAGLAAAKKLKQNKIDFIIVEARNRIGGRVHSHKIDEQENLVVELGAEWVGQSHHTIRNMCEEFNLKLDDNTLETDLLLNDKYYKSTDWSYSKNWKATFEKLKEKYLTLTDTQKNELDKMDWWRYLQINGCIGFDLEVRELLDSTDFGESIRHVSASAAMAEYAESSIKNEMDFKVAGGNDMLAKKMANFIGLHLIKLNCAVTKIVQHTNGVIVHCSNGEILKADKIICTIPTFSIKKIEWQPPLPKAQIEAIHALQYARINKTPILFTERFWQREDFDLITDTSQHYYYHATKNQVSKKGVLTSYSIGDKANVIASANKNERIKMAENALNKGFGNIASFYEKQVNYNWAADEYTMGAYALYGIGQWKSTQHILKKYFLNTYFAGEHLADWQGFMEGAVNTGAAAAGNL